MERQRESYKEKERERGGGGKVMDFLRQVGNEYTNKNTKISHLSIKNSRPVAMITF